MPKLSSKHPKSEQVFKFSGFDGGYVQDKEAQYLELNQLSACMNLKYMVEKNGVVLNPRQGTTKISSSAIANAVRATTFYAAKSKYILASSAKLYYLDGALAPVEIGNLDGIPTFTEFNGKLIIHDTGVMKRWDGTTFEKVPKLYMDEVLGTGDDIVTNFTGTLSHLTVRVSSITITFTGTAVSLEITDDGAGALEGDVDAGGTNTINYTTGAYDFTCSEAPDCDTTITVDYHQVDGGPKSKAGLVRGARLYSWGDSSYLSRITYTEVNDETSSDTSSGGGYLDVDKNDGYPLLGCLNFYTTILCFKQTSLHRIDDFPGDATFDVEKLTDDLGTLSHRTPLFEGGIISFVSKEGWMAIHPSQRFGDIQKGVPLSKDFKNNAVRYANATAYSAYNQIDNQLWLALSTNAGTNYLDYIYVSNLDANGIVSLYQFEFAHTCFSYANSEMLIGGDDGNLYKLDDTNTVFTDNEVSYADNTYFRGAYTDWQLPNNNKHNKRIQLRVVTGETGFTANLKLFKNGSYTPFLTQAVSVAAVFDKVNDGGVGLYVYDMIGTPVGVYTPEYAIKKKFNYKRLMYELSDIGITRKTDIKGVSFTSAVIGD